MKLKYAFLKDIFLVFTICLAARIIEYLFIRTDQSFFAENFIHKLFGILVLAVFIRLCNLSWNEIGFKRKDFFKRTMQGLFLGVLVFGIAYGYEFFMLRQSVPSFSWYVSAFSSSGNQGQSTGLLIFSMCIFFNIVNVVMEEGIFRGLFITLAEKKTTFMKANIIAAILFALWHIVMPLRSVLDGEMSIVKGSLFALYYIFTTFLMAFTIGFWRKITGSLWIGTAEHFVNNTIVNLLHVSTVNGADELLSVRLAIAQTGFGLISIAAYLLYRRKNAKVQL